MIFLMILVEKKANIKFSIDHTSAVPGPATSPESISVNILNKRRCPESEYLVKSYAPS